jgi:ATP-dependent RNA helicase DDX46/PRP5
MSSSVSDEKSKHKDNKKHKSKKDRSRSRDRGKDKISSRDRKRRHSSESSHRGRKRKYSSSSDSDRSHNKAYEQRMNRRKRKYDNEIDDMKGKEIDKRKEAVIREKNALKQKEESDKAMQEKLKKVKEKELTEEEKLELKKKTRLAKAKLIAMLENEEEKRNENAADRNQLNEDFLQKDDEEEVKPAEDIQMAVDIKPIELEKNVKSVSPSPMVDDEVDPLDAFMEGITKEATPQEHEISAMLYNQQWQRHYDSIAEKDGYDDTVMMVEDEELNKIDESKIVTMDDILKPSSELTREDDDEEYHKNLINALKGIKAPDIDPLYGYAEEKQAMVIYQEDANEYLKEEDFETTEEAWQRMKKQSQGKDLKVVNHAEINYQPFRKNLYRESQEVARMTKSEVEKFRLENGEIKVRGKQVPKPIFNWYQCGLSNRILAVLERKIFKDPFPIQCQAIPCIMSGRDIIGIAETGSGKTLAYVLPMLRHIADQPALKVSISINYRTVMDQYH